MSIQGAELLFAYGTLKRGFSNHAILRGAILQEEVLTRPCYRLVTLGDYPALAPGAHAIAGELYQISASLLPELDDFEGAEYVRAAVALADGRSAHAYFITPDALAGARPLNVDVWTGSAACREPAT